MNFDFVKRRELAIFVLFLIDTLQVSCRLRLYFGFKPCLKLFVCAFTFIIHFKLILNFNVVFRKMKSYIGSYIDFLGLSLPEQVIEYNQTKETAVAHCTSVIFCRLN